MLKTPEFDASYDPIVTESKGRQKTPDFHASYDLVRATNSKLLGTKILEVSKNFRVELENT